MKNENQSSKSLYTVFIGINGYQEQVANPLNGCINDVLNLSEYFKKLCEAQEEEIIWKQPKYLLAPSGETEQNRLAEEKIEYEHPTRDNIIAAFDTFNDADPKAGDFCLLYYSGHGATIPSSEIEAFADYESSGEMQTILCADDTRKDILDKELGYLIAKTLEGKGLKTDGDTEADAHPGVHFLAIFDCCHSGTISRKSRDDTKTRRARSASRANLPETILGFTKDGNCFYHPFQEGQTSVQRYPVDGLKHARYVNLSACRDSEEAKEVLFQSVIDENGEQKTIRRIQGAFSYSLIKTLNQSGTHISYRELMRSVASEVDTLVSNQIPVIGRTGLRDEKLFFLGRSFSTPKPEYVVDWDEKKGKWVLRAGQIEGIIPPHGDMKSTVQVKLSSGQTELIDIKKVELNRSILDGTKFTEADKKNRLLRATIASMAFPRIKVGIRNGISEQGIDQIKDYWNNQKPENRYYDVITDPQGVYQYEITTVLRQELVPIEGSTEKKSVEIEYFSVAKVSSETPLIPDVFDVATLFGNINAIGKWEAVKVMKNPDRSTNIAREDISIQVEIAEGTGWGAEDINEQAQHEWPQKAIDPEAINVQFVDDLQPFLKVKIHNTSRHRYWIGALYLDAYYGINASLLDIEQKGQNETAQIRMIHGQDAYDALPINMDPLFHEYGTTQIQAHLLIVVSAERFDLSNYEQPSIDFSPTRSSKGIGFQKPRKPKWSIIPIPINISRPLPKSVIGQSRLDKISGLDDYREPLKRSILDLEVPEGFTSDLQLTTEESLLRKISQKKNPSLARQLANPGSIWEGFTGSDAIFTHGLNNQPGTHLNIAEFTKLQGRLDENSPLLLAPSDPLLPDEAIIPYGYETIKVEGTQEALDFYFPFGYTDALGKIQVTGLPAETPGVIGGDGVNLDETEKSLKSSIKLCFKKVIWSRLSGRHDYHTLSLLRDNGNSLEEIQYHGRAKEKEERELIRTALADGKDTLLLVHGLTGDAEAMTEAIFEQTDLHQRFDHVLTFVYENLNTPIEEAAQQLMKLLSDPEHGVGVQPKQITLLAHSMGGLVARWMIEREGGDKLVQKLIQAGTPNGGAKLADLRKKFTGWLTLGMNGMGFIQPYMPIFAFIGRGIEKQVFRSIDQLSPTSSFLDKLSGNTKPADVPYHLLAGDTNEIEANFDENDPLWKKLKACVKDRSLYILGDFFHSDEENDLVVSRDSMTKLPWEPTSINYPQCDHFQYFSKQESLAYLKMLLGARK